MAAYIVAALALLLLCAMHRCNEILKRLSLNPVDEDDFIEFKKGKKIIAVNSRTNSVKLNYYRVTYLNNSIIKWNCVVSLSNIEVNIYINLIMNYLKSI